MILGDLIYNDNFDVNCNYAIYAGQWHKNNLLWRSKEKNWQGKWPSALLNRNIQYITLDLENKELVIEVEEENK